MPAGLADMGTRAAGRLAAARILAALAVAVADIAALHKPEAVPLAAECTLAVRAAERILAVPALVAESAPHIAELQKQAAVRLAAALAALLRLVRNSGNPASMVELRARIWGKSK